jgi:hypothetical protein
MVAVVAAVVKILAWVECLLARSLPIMSRDEGGCCSQRL